MTQVNGSKKSEQQKKSFWDSKGAQVGLRILSVVGLAVATGYCQAAGQNLFTSTTGKKQITNKNGNVISFPDKRTATG